MGYKPFNDPVILQGIKFGGLTFEVGSNVAAHQGISEFFKVYERKPQNLSKRCSAL